MNDKGLVSSMETASVLRRYFTLLYGVLYLMMIVLFWPEVDISGGAAWFFVLASTAVYASLYLLVAALPCTTLALLLPRHLAFRHPLLLSTSAAGGILMQLLLYADYRLYAMYQFHINGFVWNLLTTPGGIASLGTTTSTAITAALQVLVIVVANVIALWVLRRYRLLTIPLRRFVIPVLLLLVLFPGEEALFAYSIHTGKENVLAAADAVPFRLATSASSLLGRLGVPNTAVNTRRLTGGTVVYPSAAIASSHLRPVTNIVVLVAESFRWDLVDPQITPNLWKFSQQATRYDNHYSGGNCTREGMFSLFYGLYAPYWRSFEQQRVAPVLMNVLREHGYQMFIHTSQNFSYPELRHTVFAGVSETNLQELQQGDPWQRDISNIGDIIAKINRRDHKRPFFAFMFFESTHAPYSFPEEQALRGDYLRDFNYISSKLRSNINGIHARYINAAHHVDAQVGRLINHLERTGMIEQTVLLFTGDHGEEFLEKGYWGHGHNSFPEEQIRVPLVLWRPGAAPTVVSYRTSHLQVAPTLLAYLGVNQPAYGYASAEPLDREMPYYVFGNYNYMGVTYGRHKIVFPFTGRSYFRYSVFADNDHPVSRGERDAVVAETAGVLDAIHQESRRFAR